MYRHFVAGIATVASLTGGVADAAGPAQGLSCGLAAGTVFGGPVVFTGEIATSVIYQCTVRVVTPGGTRVQIARFESPGPVGLLPPAVASVDPDATSVEVCTQVEWVFGFPGGGSIDAGCRDATLHGGPLGGYVLLPEVIT